MLWAMSARRFSLTPSSAGASGCALIRASAAATAMRVGASSGKETSPGLVGLPRARPVLVSEGGSRISTSPRVGDFECGLDAVEVLTRVFADQRREDPLRWGRMLCRAEVTVRLIEADVATCSVRFQNAGR